MNTIIHGDCMDYMKTMPDNSVNLTLTDIPYGSVNRPSNGLRNLNKGLADVLTFELKEFCEEVARVTKGTIIIFCGKPQFSQIYGFFDSLQRRNKGTVRELIWQKSNPSPMNGKYIYLSDTENAVWFKKHGGVFNAYCKGTVFKFPCGRSKLHPTEKNHKLLEELILDNSNEGDLVFDPCAGSGSHCKVARDNGRNYLGIELNDEYYQIAVENLKETA